MPANLGLQHQRIDRHHEGTAGHGQRRDLRTQHEGVQDPRSERERDRVVAHRPPHILVHLAKCGARQLDRGNDVIRVALHQDDIGAFHGHVSAGAYGKPHVRLGERRRVVDPIAHHADLLARGLQRLYLFGLLGRQHVGQHGADAEIRGDALGGGRVVAYDQRIKARFVRVVAIEPRP